MINFIKKLLKKKESPVNSIGKTDGFVAPVKKSDFLPSTDAPKTSQFQKSTTEKPSVQTKKTDSTPAKKQATAKKPGRPKGQTNKSKTDKK